MKRLNYGQKELSLSKKNVGKYQDHLSPSIYVRFPIEGKPGSYIVIWTTTPWTIPANEAISVNENLDYVIAKGTDNSLIIIASDLLGEVSKKL